MEGLGQFETMTRVDARLSIASFEHRHRRSCPTLKFVASRIFLPVNSALMFLQAKAANFPLALLLGYLPSPMLPARPPFAKTVQTHAVTPLSRAHGTPTLLGSCRQYLLKNIS
jgi:hypothetical protein